MKKHILLTFVFIFFFSTLFALDKDFNFYDEQNFYENFYPEHRCYDNNLDNNSDSNISNLTSEIPIEQNQNTEIIKSHYSRPEDFIGRPLKYVYNKAEVLLEKGILLNESLLYKKAIEVLTEAIKLDPNEPEAYLERALAYFETDHIHSAIKDYKKWKHQIKPPYKSKIALRSKDYLPKDKKEFAKGLFNGTYNGMLDASKELIPSYCDCLRGIFHGIWIFAKTPIKVSQEIINTAYEIGEFIADHDSFECLECVVPELRDLKLTWEKINDYLRGQKIGYLIGKYGVEIFAPVGAAKCIVKINALKRAHVAFTLEQCTSSKSCRASILKESAGFAVRRETLVQKAAKTRTILVKNYNTKYHIMQKKHAWEKIINLSGNIEEDFKKVIFLLEENGIFSEKNFLESRSFFDGNIIRKDYKMIIHGYEVNAVLETNNITNHSFLNDAWIALK